MHATAISAACHVISLFGQCHSGCLPYCTTVWPLTASVPANQCVAARGCLPDTSLCDSKSMAACQLQHCVASSCSIAFNICMSQQQLGASFQALSGCAERGLSRMQHAAGPCLRQAGTLISTSRAYAMSCKCEHESSKSRTASLQVGFCEGLELQGGTPAFMPALLTFNHVMRAWHENGVTVERVHQHVMGLHQEFYNALGMLQEAKGSNNKLKFPPQHMAPEAVRSHSLVRMFCWASASANLSIF